MFKQISLTCMFSCFALFAFANLGDQITLEGNQATQASSVYDSTVSNLQQNAQNRAQAYTTLATFIQSNTAEQNPSGPSSSPQVGTGVIVFVSLGMPTLSLRQIIISAKELHIPVVVRGVLNNHFKDSAKALYAVLHPQGQPPINGGIEIDPVWFEGFGINQVPAVVAVPPGVSCTDKTPCNPDQFDVVYGNIPVPEALAIIAKNGTVGKDVAQHTLAQLGEGANQYED